MKPTKILGAAAAGRTWLIGGCALAAQPPKQPALASDATLPAVELTFAADDLNADALAGYYRTYDDPAGRFSVSYPEAWAWVQADDEPDKVMFVNLSLGDSAERGAVAVLIDPLARGFALNDGIQRAHEALVGGANASEVTVVKQQGVEINGLRGIDRTITYKQEGTELAARMVLLIDDAHLYSIGLTTRRENLPDYTPVLRRYSALVYAELRRGA